MNFKATSVYGGRKGYYSLLLITSSKAGNIFLKANVFKRSVINDVEMLPRSGMRKPFAVAGQAWVVCI